MTEGCRFQRAGPIIEFGSCLESLTREGGGVHGSGLPNRVDAGYMEPRGGMYACFAGCLNCYAARMALRLERMPNGTGEKYAGTAVRARDGRPVFTGRINLDEEALDLPRSWPLPRTIFVRMSAAHVSSLDETARARPRTRPATALAKAHLDGHKYRDAEILRTDQIAATHSRSHPIPVMRTPARAAAAPPASRHPLGDRRRRKRTLRTTHAGHMGTPDQTPMRSTKRAVLLQAVGRGEQEGCGEATGGEDVG